MQAKRRRAGGGGSRSIEASLTATNGDVGGAEAAGGRGQRCRSASRVLGPLRVPVREGREEIFRETT